MTFDEKNTWIYGIVSLTAYGLYLAKVLSNGTGLPLHEVPYVATMLWSIGVAIAASIIGVIIVSISAPKEADKRDVRDKEIARLGDHVGHSFVVIGALAAMCLALARVDHFWIANAVYLCFVVSALLSAMTKIAAYRGAFQAW